MSETGGGLRRLIAFAARPAAFTVFAPQAASAAEADACTLGGAIHDNTVTIAAVVVVVIALAVLYFLQSTRKAKKQMVRYRV